MTPQPPVQAEASDERRKRAIVSAFWNGQELQNASFVNSFPSCGMIERVGLTRDAKFTLHCRSRAAPYALVRAAGGLPYGAREHHRIQ
jgi:hypothetical protein